MAMNPYAALVDDDGSDSGEDSPRALSVYDAGLGSDVATGYESPILDHYLPPGDPVESAPPPPLISTVSTSMEAEGYLPDPSPSSGGVSDRYEAAELVREPARRGSRGLQGPGQRAGEALNDAQNYVAHAAMESYSLYLQSKPSNAPTLERAAPLAQAAAAPKGETSRVGYPIDWNNEFQRLLELPENTEDQKLKKYLELGALSKNFLAMAKRWGKVIIEESFLPPKYRTIMPIDIGGQAGGEKYIYCGILFKLQKDWKGIYGGDFNAMKTGGLELKGLMRYFGCRDLHVSLMAVIDYRGFRLVAQSILPIDKQTHVYGSSDGGNTILAKDADFNAVMENAAATLNIKGHYVGPSKDALVRVHAPADIEGHIGTDGRYYVLDFARVFPPTAEESVRTTFLYKVFRPEFIKRYRVPLSSDAYSNFAKFDPQRDPNNREVLEATNHLLTVTVPTFARWLDAHYASLKLPMHLTSLTEIVHREGINVRYLGHIRTHVASPDLKRLLLMEMAARVIKNKVRLDLREMMKQKATLAGDAFVNIVLDTFNKVLGLHDESERFWSHRIKERLSNYFKSALDADEQAPTFDLKTRLDLKLLFKRLQQLLGVKLSSYSKKEFEEKPDDFKLVIADIKGIRVTVKKMNTISLAEANALAIQAMQALSKTGSRHHDRLFRLAMARFDSAILATPDNIFMINHYASILSKIAVLKASAREEALFYFDTAFEKFNVARNLDGLLQLGHTIESTPLIWSERDRALVLADRCYQEVIRADGMNYDAFRSRARLLLRFAHRKRSGKYYSEAGDMFRTAIQLQPVGEFSGVAELAPHVSDQTLALLIELTADPTTFDTSRCFSTAFITDDLLQTAAKHLPSLQTFKLAKCSGITDQGVIALAKSYPDLHLLDLSECDAITDNAIGHLAACRRLSSLDVSGCANLTEFSFKSIVGKLVELQSLKVASLPLLDGQHLTGLEWMASSRLTTLSLAHTTMLPDLWCKSMFLINRATLLEVDLSDMANVTDACVAALVKDGAVKLQKLRLAGCSRLTDDAVHQVAQHCPQLRYLDLANVVALTPKALAHLALFYTHLETLLLDRCTNMFDDGAKAFGEFAKRNPRLQRLSLGGVSFGPDALQHFSTLKSLTDLDLSNTPSDSQGLNVVWRASSSLVKVNLAGVSALTDESLLLLARSSGSSLRTLLLSGCRKLSKALVELGTLCPGLTELDISFSNVTDEALDLLTSRLPQLEKLVSVESKAVTNTGAAFLGRLHELRHLDLSKSLLITNVSALATGCPELRTLNLEKCVHVESKTLLELSQAPALRDLNVIGCHGVDDNLLVSFAMPEAWPCLEKMHVGGGTKFSEGQLEKYLNDRSSISVSVRLSNSSLVPSPQGNKKVQILNQSTKTVPSLQAAASPASVARASATASRTLFQDLKQLTREPVPSVSAAPLSESNVFVWHCNLRAPDHTPYAGAVFHIELNFPEDYPSSPPSAFILTPCPHPHVKNGRICLDILSDFSSFFSNSSGSGQTSGGWSSAYSVQTILLQIQTFLMDLTTSEGDEPIANYLSRVPAAIEAANAYTCSKCQHTPDNPWPELPEKDLKRAPKPSKTELDIIRDELRCYHTRVRYTDDVLGIGLQVEPHDGALIKSISSPLELLSRTAFFDNKVRTAVYDVNDLGERLSFNDWLPVYICKEHGDRAIPLIEESIARICSKKIFKPELVLEVLPVCMNTMVVSVMSGKLHGSVKALEGYVAFHRLFILFVHRYPQLLEQINDTVANFIQSEAGRTKKACPDLGRFLTLLSVSDYNWNDVSSAYLDENFTRNVRWVIQKNPEFATAKPNPDVDRNRAAKTFISSQTSLHLLLYNVHFLANIGRPPSKSLKEVADQYDAMYGRPTNSMKDVYLEGITEIKRCTTWPKFFKRINVSVPSEEELVTWLRQSVTRSLQAGYHSASEVSPMASPKLDRLVASSSGVQTSPKPSFGRGRGSSPPTPSSSQPKKKEVCRQWQAGTCTRGRECRFQHHF